MQTATAAVKSHKEAKAVYDEMAEKIWSEDGSPAMLAACYEQGMKVEDLRKAKNRAQRRERN